MVELIGVIILLGIIALITFPIIDLTIENSKEKSLQRTIENIEEAAYNYSVENNLGYSTNIQLLTLDELKLHGYLPLSILNPFTKEELSGCVNYFWDESLNQYKFDYTDNCEIPETEPKILLKYNPDLINSNGWISDNFAISVTGNGNLKYCISNTECEPNEIIENGNNTKFLVNNGTNYICANSSNSVGTTETICEKFMIDKDLPVITANANDITVKQKESHNIENFLTVTYGISGGNFSCDIDNTDKLFVGTHVVNCTATGNNGLSVTKTAQINVEKVYFDYEIKIVWDKDTFALPSAIPINLNNDVEIVYSFVTDESAMENNTGELIYSIENIPKYDDNNNEINYYLTSMQMVEMRWTYYPIINGNIIEVKAVYTPPVGSSTKNIAVMATLNDLNCDVIRPENIEINLLKDGNIYGSDILNKNNGWSITFFNLPISSSYDIEVINKEQIEKLEFQVSIEENNNIYIIYLDAQCEF